MKTPLLIVFMASCLPSYAQQLAEKFSLPLPDSLPYHNVAWADADNDGLLDIVVFAKNGNGVESLLFFKNNSGERLQYAGTLSTGIREAASFVADIDGDNQLDIIVSGYLNSQPVTLGFINGGNFSFIGEELAGIKAGKITMADLDQDGTPEVVLSGRHGSQPFLHMLKRHLPGWAVIHDSIRVEASSIEIFDFDADNDMDMLISGRDMPGNPVTTAYYNEGGLLFVPKIISPSLTGLTTQADLNYDGNFDMLIAGADAAGDHHHTTLVNTSDGFQVKDSLTSLRDQVFFAADFYSDGTCDMSLRGIRNSGDTLNVIVSASRRDTLSHHHMAAQAIGDLEHDGDLDLVQLKNNSGSFTLSLIENRNPTPNRPPGRPSDPVVAHIFNRLFIHWQKPVDDHTPINSLTYDVTVQSVGNNIMTGQFDLLNGQRLNASHGNNGTSNFLLIYVPQPRPVSFHIQAVDNSLHGGKSGICSGSGGQNPCLSTETTMLEACRNETLSLESNGVAQWFSFREGFLAEGKNLDFRYEQPDTVFSVLRQEQGCAALRIYIISTPAGLTKTTDFIDTVCQGQLLRKGVEPGWPHVEWSAAASGFISAKDSIDFIVTAPDTLRVKVTDGAGCSIERNFVLVISKPVITTSHDAYQMLKGESVRLQVSGGTGYQWTPAAGLDNPAAADPLATPSRTTAYVVTVTDSLGCSADTTILVLVEETAFIPNLFTPNKDGSNDVLKIYGLDQAKDFSFTIFNREGNAVFYSENINEIVHAGWNGTSGGVEQPSGVYFWKVKGTTTAGKNVLLNGKYSGSIVLMR